MRNSPLLVIFLVVFIDLVGFGIVIPILPYYAQDFGASAWELGWLMASYSVMQFVFAPLWGKISDHIGRRRVLLMTLMGSGLSLLFLSSAKSLTGLFIGRVFAGIFGANISTAYAYVTDVTTPENRAKGMGLIGAGFGLGFVFGPAIGGILSQYGYGFPMLFAAFLTFVNLVFALFKLEEPRLKPGIRAMNRNKRFEMDHYRIAFKSLKSRLAIGVFFLVTLAVTQMESVFAIYMKYRFHYDARSAGLLLALSGIIMIIVQGGLIGKLSRRFGETQLVLFGTIVCGAALIGFASSSVISFLITSLCFLSIGHGILHPSLSSLASLGAADHQRGATMGVFHSAGSLARVLGPPFAGFLYDRVAIQAPFVGASVILGVAFTVTWAVRGRS